MQYKIFKASRKGLILTRNIEEVKEDLTVQFLGAPDGATAIFTDDKNGSVYKTLDDKKSCVLPKNILQSPLKVVVTVIGGTKVEPIYSCETIVPKVVGNTLVVMPEEIDSGTELRKVYDTMQKLSDKYDKLEKKYNALSERLESLMEGYDLV
jgi:hypothetical protein